MTIKQKSHKILLADIWGVERCNTLIPDSFTLPKSKYERNSMIIETETHADGVPILISRFYTAHEYDSLSWEFKLSKIEVYLNL